MKLRRPSRRVAICLVVLLTAAAAAVVGPSLYVRQASAGARYSADDVPDAPVAIVFGAGIRGDRPTPFLQRRLDIAIDLFNRGRVRALLMTGDNSTRDHDEVGVMAAYAAAAGVPPSAIASDHAGFDTYDSCYRAKVIFGVRRAVVVTQKFHLARAIFVCAELGVQAFGVGDDSSRRWPGPTRRYAARELLSTTKALWEIRVTRPKPKFLGPRETVPGAVHSVDNSWG